MSLSSAMPRFLAAFLFFVVGSASPALAAPFTVLSYNIHGLPPTIEVGGVVVGVGNPDSPTTIPQIAASLNSNIGNWDVVAIQEAFVPAYYDAVNAVSPNTPPFDPPVPPALTGSGLTRLSQDPFTGYVRETWDACGPNSGDCFADKGFSMARHAVQGQILDIYNLHADAGQEALDISVRNGQLVQLADRIDLWSGDNAVIVLGDTNSLFNRVMDTLPSFLASTSLEDAWVELVNGGTTPAGGSSPLAGCSNDPETDPEICERVDKVFYRSSDTLSLVASDYSVPAALFQDTGMNDLSDHRPVQVTFDANVVPEPGTGTLLLAGLVGLASRRRSRNLR